MAREPREQGRIISWLGRLRPDRSSKLSMSMGAGLVAGAVGLFGAGLGLFLGKVPRGVRLVSLQWAGGRTAASTLVRGLTHQYRLGLDLDMRFLIPGYLIGLVAACYLGWKVFQSKDQQNWALIGVIAAVMAGLLNYVQDVLLLAGLGPGRPGSWVFVAAEVMSFSKFTALLVAGVVAVLAVTTATGRMIAHRGTVRRWKKALSEVQAERASQVAAGPPPTDKGPGMESGAATGRLAGTGTDQHWLDGYHHPDGYRPGGTGICLSGGGIRSACVALGALQELRAHGHVLDADYLVSVSGGGYTAGGLQLALTPHGGWPGNPPPPSPDSSATPADVFSAGSPETDYLRRHSSYLAVNFRQWAVCLGVLLRGVFAGAVIGGLTVVTAGLMIAWFYRYVPVIEHGNLAALKPSFLLSRPPAGPPAFPAIPVSVWLTIGAAALLALVGLVAVVWVPARHQNLLAARTLKQLTRGLAGAAVLLAVVGLAVPGLVWASAWVSWRVMPHRGPLAATGAVSFALSYAGTLIATLWRKRKRIAGVSGLFSMSKNRLVKQVLPNSMVQMILIWLILIVIVLGALLAAGWVATSGLDSSAWAAVPLGLLAAVTILLDQTTVSLHPFYRRRLASAFAVRRAGGVAQRYQYSEQTDLSIYGSRAPGFPAVTFAAAANVKDQGRTPPGRPALSFGLSGDWIGGPRVGWLRSDFIERLVSDRIRADLTVEAAMAISGAAFASAMGSATAFYDVFLALTNARLGAWLPNPKFVRRKLDALDDWRIPGLPRIRRLSYYYREVFGIHPDSSRMLLCTDGGHYDNLGLVELLRRRPKLVFCVDGSAPSGPLNETLARAIEMAREELGIEIMLKDTAYNLVPGTGCLPQPKNGCGKQAGRAMQLDDLRGRLSAAAVIVGQIKYPELPGVSAATRGKLIFAQAVLTGDMPYELLDYPQENLAFPRDSTADQWFAVAQFGAYTRLGQVIGGLASDLAVAGRRHTTVVVPPQRAKANGRS